VVEAWEGLSLGVGWGLILPAATEKRGLVGSCERGVGRFMFGVGYEQDTSNSTFYYTTSSSKITGI